MHPADRRKTRPMRTDYNGTLVFILPGSEGGDVTFILPVREPWWRRAIRWLRWNLLPWRRWRGWTDVGAMADE
jgi:hypothetical protein